MAALTKTISPAFRRTAVLKRYRNMIRQHNTYIDAIIIDKAELTFVFRLRNFPGDDGEFKEFTNGEYLFVVIPPEDFPHSPPSFSALTPNGVFELGGKICISTGEFHKQNYVSTRGLEGFGDDVRSVMVQYTTVGGGVRILENATPEIISKFAKQSMNYNRQHYKKYIEQLDELPMNWLSSKMKSYCIGVPVLDKGMREYLGL